MKPIWIFIATLVALPIAAETNGGGSLMGRVGETHQNKLFGKWDLTLFGNWYDTHERFSVNLQAKGIYGQGALDESDARIEKALFTWRASQNWELFFGRTSEIWGRLDELTALDFPFAEDQRWKYWDEPVNRKLARTLIGQKLFWGNQTLSLMVFPKRQSHETEIIDSGWCDQSCQWNTLETQTITFQNQGFTVLHANEDKSHEEGAARWTGLIGDADVGWTAYYGSDHWARISRAWGENQTVILKPTTFQNWSTGLDTAISFGDWVMRGELAYRKNAAMPIEPDSNSYLIDDDGFTERSVTSLAAALETTWASGIRTNIQILYSSIAGSKMDLVIPREINAATFFIEKSFFEHNITLQNRLIYDFDHKGHHNRAKIAWNPILGTELALEASFFEGDNKLRNYGYLSQNNGVFLTLLHEY